ncbi:hypothetical protein CIB48_g5470 [Xylaria polymorpha]|nr:hypothetical protein CIB48_g5470 [Xylaria polymorpha]
MREIGIVGGAATFMVTPGKGLDYRAGRVTHTIGAKQQPACAWRVEQSRVQSAESPNARDLRLRADRHATTASPITGLGADHGPSGTLAIVGPDRRARSYWRSLIFTRLDYLHRQTRDGSEEEEEEEQIWELPNTNTNLNPNPNHNHNHNHTAFGVGRWRDADHREVAVLGGLVSWCDLGCNGNGKSNTQTSLVSTLVVNQTATLPPCLPYLLLTVLVVGGGEDSASGIGGIGRVGLGVGCGWFSFVDIHVPSHVPSHVLSAVAQSFEQERGGMGKGNGNGEQDPSFFWLALPATYHKPQSSNFVPYTPYPATGYVTKPQQPLHLHPAPEQLRPPTFAGRYPNFIEDTASRRQQHNSPRRTTDAIAHQLGRPTTQLRDWNPLAIRTRPSGPHHYFPAATIRSAVPLGRRGLADDTSIQPPPNDEGIPPPAEYVPRPIEPFADNFLNEEAIAALEEAASGQHALDLIAAGLKYGMPTPPGKRDKLQDRYHPVVHQITRMLMRDGKLSRAQKLPLNPAPLPDSRDRLGAPVVRVRSLKGLAGGGTALDVPEPIDARARRRQAIMWILDIVNKKRSTGSGRKQFAARFGQEIIAVIEGTSAAWDRRQLIHKMGTAARANLSHHSLSGTKRKF